MIDHPPAAMPADLSMHAEAWPSHPTGTSRVLAYRALGLAAVAIGLVGVFMPMLPTTPFLLVAVWAFARSSPRLERWLREHPRLGPPITAWEARGAVPRGAKVAAVAAMAASLGLMAVVGVPAIGLALAAAVLSAAALWLCSRPS